MSDLTKDEAFTIAEFIDMNIFQAIRNDEAARLFVKTLERMLKVDRSSGR